MEFEGRKLRVGSVDDLRHAKAERVQDRIVPRSQSEAKKDKPAGGTEKSFIPSSMIRRPVLGRPGPKRGGGFPAPRILPISNAKSTAEDTKPEAKSNADFKELFLKGSVAKDNKDNKEDGN
jgi:hypothetical protein